MMDVPSYLKGRERALDQIWDWMETEVTCEKPDPVLAQLVTKILKMRDDKTVPK